MTLLRKASDTASLSSIEAPREENYPDLYLDVTSDEPQNENTMGVSGRAKIQTAIGYFVLSGFSAYVAFYARGLTTSADATEQLTTIVRPIVVFMTILSVLLLGISTFLFMAARRQTREPHK